MGKSFTTWRRLTKEREEKRIKVARRERLGEKECADGF